MNNKQFVRLIDIGFIAPYLAYIGFKSKGNEKLILLSLSAGTFLYNLINYLKEENK